MAKIKKLTDRIIIKVGEVEFKKFIIDFIKRNEGPSWSQLRPDLT